MKYLIAVIIALSLVFLPAGYLFSNHAPSESVAHASTVPTFTILSIVSDQTVSIKTYNFPANDVFDVLMGPIGTQAINGIWVASQPSGSGGTLTATYDIHDALKGSYQIAIRLQSSTGSGYYAYNWFYNNSTAGLPPSPGWSGTGYTGYPSFTILSVIRNQSVTIQTYNLTPDDSFVVTMGPMGTRGINGYIVATTDSGTGGSQQLTYTIPTELYDSYQISIRMQSSASGYYAYNWFYNNTTGGTGGPEVPTPTPVATATPGPTPTAVPPPAPGYTGYPTFSIVSVVRNQSVTIQTYNLPPNDTFVITMGPMGTRGINGYIVGTTDSGVGDSQQYSFAIPPELYDSYQISIRMQSPYSGYYAFNWFYNNTYP